MHDCQVKMRQLGRIIRILVISGAKSECKSNKKALPCERALFGHVISCLMQLCYVESGLRYFDLDLLRFGFLRLAQLDSQKAVLVVSRNLAAVDRLGQAERPAETSGLDFGADISTVLFLFLEFTFAGNGQDVFLHADFDILFVDTRQFQGQREFVRRFMDINCRHESRLVVLPNRIAEKTIEHVVNLVCQVKPMRSGNLAPHMNSSF